MGTVHAKAAPAPNTTEEPSQPRKITVRVNEVPVKVQRVHIDGLGRTKNDAVVPEVQDMFSATKFEDVVLKSLEAKSKLESFGAFKKVTIFIDTASGIDARQDGVEVTFFVEETNRLGGGIHTSIGNDEGSVVFGLRAPNAFGRGERFVGEYSYGSRKSQGFHLGFVKPFLQKRGAKVTIGALQGQAEYPWSGFTEIDRALNGELTLNSLLGLQHIIRWEGAWRELRCEKPSASFAVREQCGHSLKSALHHTLLYDTRDNPVIPNDGFLVRISKELAGYGLGGDVNFLKGNVDLQLNKSLLFGTVLQATLSSGVLFDFNKEAGARMCDRYFLGGPLTLRGFQTRGAGPHSEGDSIGASSYCSGGLHLYTPLPFRPGKGGFGDLFRTHIFINGGSIGSLYDNYHQVVEQFRWAYGAGIVLCLGSIARLELNYAIPVRYLPGDKTNKGFQFGVGISFL